MVLCRGYLGILNDQLLLLGVGGHGSYSWIILIKIHKKFKLNEKPKKVHKTNQRPPKQEAK